ncbi:hypothetical protein ACFE04_005457 [Oxalis oulophora]
MATIIYQGVQSCQQQTQQLRFKLSVPQEKCNSSQSNSDYTFLQNLCSSKSEEEKTITTKPYIHPSMEVTRSLSEKSLEICTENLGSENGSDDNIDHDHLFEKTTFSEIRQQSTPRNKKLIRSVTNFPPPLTTMSGSSSSGSIFMRSHREEGRLIVEAVKVPSSPPSVFKAERSEGRLRLCFNKDDSSVVQSTDELNEAQNEVLVGEKEEEHMYMYFDEEEKLEGQVGNYTEVGGKNDQIFHQRSLIDKRRCNEVGECESTHNKLIRWGVAISIS